MPEERPLVRLPLVGVRLVRVLSEYAAVLDFANETRIRIEMPFRLRVGGSQRTYDPQSDTDEPADMQPFVGSAVSEASTSHEGALRLVLDHDVTIEVDPSDTYEAWEFIGLNGSRVIALGDRSLAVWDARNDV